MKSSVLSQPVGYWYVEVYGFCLLVCLFVFCTSNVQEENSGDVVFLTFTFSIVVCEDTCAPICF